MVQTAAELGARISRVRTHHHMSIQDVADRSKITFQTVWRIEQGYHKEPGVFTITRLAKALGCSVDYLVGLYEPEKEH